MPEYPLLKENLELLSVLKNIDDNTKKASSLIDDIQKNCKHVLYKNYAEDPNYIWSHYGNNKKILKSKTCTLCGFVEEKPKGDSWDICHMCWAPMKHVTTIPGQGCRRFVYECTECKHTVSHT